MTRRVIALLAAAIVLSGCTQATTFSENRAAVQAGPGDPIEMTVENVQAERVPSGENEPFSLDVVVANNAGAELTVKRINVTQTSYGPIAVDPWASDFDRTIVPGKEEKFTAKLIAHPSRSPRDTRDPSDLGTRIPSVDLRIEVRLASGDSYYSTFEIPIDPRQ